MKNNSVPILTILFAMLFSPNLIAASENSKNLLNGHDEEPVYLQITDQTSETSDIFNNEESTSNLNRNRIYSGDLRSWQNWQNIWSSVKNLALISLKVDSSTTQGFLPMTHGVSDKGLSRLVAALGQEYKANPYSSASKSNSWNSLYLNSIARAQSNNIITVGMVDVDIPTLTLAENIQNRLREAGISEDGDLGLLMANSQNIDAISEGVEKLAQTTTECGSMLTRDNFQALIDKAEHARELANGLAILYEGGALTEENREIIFNFDAQSIESIAKALVQSVKKRGCGSEQNLPAQKKAKVSQLQEEPQQQYPNKNPEQKEINKLERATTQEVVQELQNGSNGEDLIQSNLSMIGGNSRVGEISNSKFVMHEDSHHQHTHKHYHYNGLNNQDLDELDTEDEDLADNDRPALDIQERNSLVNNYYQREQSANVVDLAKRLDQHGVVAITGIAGAGKSQLAYYYAHKIFKEKYSNAFIVTVSCDSEENLNASYRDFAVNYLAMPDEEESLKNLAKVKRYVIKQMQSRRYKNTPFILIFDGVDNLTNEDIESYFPNHLQSESQQIIITSQREGFFPSAGQNFYIDGFTFEEAIGFLQEGSTIQYEDAKRLAKEFSNLPLGLQCAKMYIKKTGVSIDGYLQRLKDQNTIVEETEDRLMRQQGYYKGKRAGYRTQRAAITLAIEQLSAKAKYLLKCCSFFNNDRVSRPILESLLAMQAPEFGFAGAAVSAVLDDILLEFKDYSLLVFPEQEDTQNTEIKIEEESESQDGSDKGQETLKMHQVVQRAAGSQMGDEEKKKIVYF